MITPGSYFGSKYRVGHQIGSGGFSKVYQGVNIITRELVAIKTEEEGGHRLKHEARVYESLIGGVGVPFVHWFGTEHGYNALVIDLLGYNLEQLFNYCNRQFSLKTVLLLGDQLISLIEYIHSKSLIHGDIKPKNFAIGFGMLENQINVLDFGLTKHYRDPRTRAHRSYRENQPPKGTPRYMSINAHLGITQSRRDDMLSLGYMLLYFLCGSLPWQGLKAATSKQKDDMIKMMKATCIEELRHDSPLTAYFTYIRSLKFDEKPDYCYLRDIFRDFFEQQAFQNDYLFDWIVYRERRNLVAGVHEEQLCGQSGRLDESMVFLQPSIHPLTELTEESLVSQLRVIYLLLSCDENELFIEVEFFKLRNKDPRDTSIDWPHLVARMTAFLHKCRDFYLASNHPIASDKIKRLGKDYSVPSRMWRILQSLLEVMQNGLPNSLEHMLSVIRMAYRCLTVILKYDTQHKEIWIECLGDVSRYRMAIEEVDMKVRALHREVASYWYKKAVNLNPEEGRLQHHLGVLARPDVLRQLFYYSKALISVKPFSSARETMTMDAGLFPKMATEYPAYPQALTIFVEAHRLLFTRQDHCLFIQQADEFVSQLDGHISNVGPMFRDQGVYIVASNYAAIFNYGHDESEMMAIFNMAKLSQTRNLDILNEAYQYWQNPSCRQLSVDQVAEDTQSGDTVVSLASKLAFATLGIILDRKEDSTMLPSVHVSLAFLWCLAVVPRAMNRIQTYVPWKRIADYLNMCITPDTDMSEIENAEFPGNELGPVRQFPEDFFIRGFSWSQLYFPQGFFRESEEDSESDIEFPPVTKSRKRRCLWKGIRLAEFKCWLEYDSEERKFFTTPFADDLAALRDDTKPIKMNLVGLPTELLQHLAEFLEEERDISALTRTSRYLHSVFIPCLYRNENNSIALLWAASKGNVDTARTSIQYGANPNAMDDYGRTPLSRAASEGHEAVVKLLLNTAGVNSDSKDDDGLTPLSWAASEGHKAVVKLLLNTAGVDLDSKDDDGCTPLLWAASEGHKAVVKLLLDTDRVDPDSKDNYGWTPLLQAASKGHEAVVKLLLNTDRVDPNSKGNDGSTSLLQAALGGHEAVVKLLLNTAGVDPDSKDNDDCTPLSRAALKGHEAVVKLLLNMDGVNPDPKDNYGWTPLLRAALGGHEAVVKLLLNTDGVNPDPKDNYGRTPLFWAASKGYEAIVKLLLNMDGVNPDPKDNYGRTPLFQAVSKGHEAIVKLLLNLGSMDYTG